MKPLVVALFSLAATLSAQCVLKPNPDTGLLDCTGAGTPGPPGAGVTTINTLTALTQTFAVGTTGSDFNIVSAGSAHTFNCPSASASIRGCISTADWSTFNGKESVLTFSAPLTRSVNTVSIPAATSSVDGYLASADWVTFNAKYGLNSSPTFITATATTFVGALTGNASTATALSANPANCSANQAASGITASGVAESCLDLPALYQPLDTDLTAVAALAATGGMLARTGAGAFAVRTVTGTANQITVTNGDGVAGAPTLSFPTNMTLPGNTTGTFIGNLTGTASGSQPLDSDLTTIAAFTPTDNGVMVGNTSTWQVRVIPDCDNPTTSKLLYDDTANAFSCGTDQSGGAGGSGITSALLASGTSLTITHNAALTNFFAVDIHCIDEDTGLHTDYSSLSSVTANALTVNFSTTVTNVRCNVVTSQVTAPAQNIASGTVALGTSAIASGACATVATATATGAATTDILISTPNADISAVTGYAPVTTGALSIYPYVTTNTANWKVCNPTSSSITPGAVTLNWRITR